MTIKKQYQKREGEMLYEWVHRLAYDVLWSRMEPDERKEILSEVSKQSYFEGVHMVEEIDKKYQRR